MFEMLDPLLKQLASLREQHGEETYNQARREIALAIILKPKGDEFVKKMWPDLDLDELRKAANEKLTGSVKAEPVNEGSTPKRGPKEAHGPDPRRQVGDVNSVMVEMLRQQIPSLTTQAQFNAFMACFDALRGTLDAYFRGDAKQAAESRDALNQGLDMAARLKQVAEQVAEIPEEERSRNAQALLDPPAQYEEGSACERLLAELEAITSIPHLSVWYTKNRVTLDGVVSQQLRNKLFDAIRNKRNELQESE